MSSPIVNSNGLGGFHFLWKTEMLEAYVSRIKEHRSGETKAEILITTSAPGWQPKLHQSLFNLSGPQSRVTLAKQLTSTFPKPPVPWDWLGILTEIANVTLERFREGEPVQELWTHEDVPKLEFLLEPLIVKGVPNIIFGEKGVTKSTMSLICYICLTLPWYDNPLELIVPDKSTQTLILDYELPGYIAQRNIKRLQLGLGLPNFPIYHRRCKVPLAQEVEQVAKHIARLKAKAVIIDSLARATGGELNKTEPANAFFEALDRLEVTSLILAQTSKDIESKRKTIYGNALFTYYSRNIWELCKTEPTDEHTVDVALFQRESNLTKHYPNMSFRFSFGTDSTSIERQPVNIAEFITKVTMKGAILDELRGGSLSVKELSDRIGHKENPTRVVLTRLKKQGLVINLESGLWGRVFREKAVN